jgi:hypothetical protein
MEGQSIHSSVSGVISWPKGYENEAMRLLLDLQMAHDNATRRHVEGEVLWDFAGVKAGSLVLRLVQVAHKYGLDTSFLESLWPNAKLVSTPPAG